MVGDGAAPALAGAFPLTGPDPFRVLLPGDNAARALDAHRLRPVGAAHARTQALSLEPGEGAGLALRSRGQQDAARRPHAGEGIVADQRVAILGQVRGALHALRTGDAKGILEIGAGGQGIVVGAGYRIGDRPRARQIGGQRVLLIPGHRVGRAATAAVLARPDRQHLVAVGGHEAAAHIAWVGDPLFPHLDLDGGAIRRVGQIGALPGGAVVEADRAVGIALAVARKAAVALLLDKVDGAVDIVGDQRLGLVTGLDQGPIGVVILNALGQQRAVRGLRRDIDRQHAEGRVLGLQVRCVGDVLSEHGSIISYRKARCHEQAHQYDDNG